MKKDAAWLLDRFRDLIGKGKGQFPNENTLAEHLKLSQSEKVGFYKWIHGQREAGFSKVLDWMQGAGFVVLSPDETVDLAPGIKEAEALRAKVSALEKDNERLRLELVRMEAKLEYADRLLQERFAQGSNKFAPSAPSASSGRKTG